MYASPNSFDVELKQIPMHELASLTKKQLYNELCKCLAGPIAEGVKFRLNAFNQTHIRNIVTIGYALIYNDDIDKNDVHKIDVDANKCILAAFEQTKDIIITNLPKLMTLANSLLKTGNGNTPRDELKSSMSHHNLSTIEEE
ncbi:hypothetical protein Bhyg_14955 [Pseudolycoriella hygida]|uniref:Uncharacterized protein n=1 Tax=Pseudolycoriella hygida TaxID=35572 RepID=A0A9Q0MQY3_9DIPT|nr:hypothetical protein Bhyg_14955 [Pseudolycoriella hygida]